MKRGNAEQAPPTLCDPDPGPASNVWTPQRCVSTESTAILARTSTVRWLLPRLVMVDERYDDEAGIECIVEGELVVLPATHVDQIVEYEVASLPLARRWVSGVGVRDGVLVLSVHLSGAPSRGTRRTVKGVLLSGHVGVAARCAVEVDQVRSLVHVSRPSEARTASKKSEHKAPWLRESTPRDGRRVEWLDVARMVHDLFEVQS